MRALLSILAKKNILRTKAHPQSPRVVIKPRGLDGDVVCDSMAGLSGSCLKEDRPPYNEREGGGGGGLRGGTGGCGTARVEIGYIGDGITISGVSRGPFEYILVKISKNDICLGWG